MIRANNKMPLMWAFAFALNSGRRPCCPRKRWDKPCSNVLAIRSLSSLRDRAVSPARSARCRLCSAPSHAVCSTGFAEPSQRRARNLVVAIRASRATAIQ